jgi:hypothetical protein
MKNVPQRPFGSRHAANLRVAHKGSKKLIICLCPVPVIKLQNPKILTHHPGLFLKKKQQRYYAKLTIHVSSFCLPCNARIVNGAAKHLHFGVNALNTANVSRSNARLENKKKPNILLINQKQNNHQLQHEPEFPKHKSQPTETLLKSHRSHPAMYKPWKKKSKNNTKTIKSMDAQSFKF